MSKYISIFFLVLGIGIIFFMILGNVCYSEDPAETAVFTFGTITVILLSYVIAQMHYLIDLINKKR